MRRVLILGGTTEARLLAEQLVGREDLSAMLSLAGRTATPRAQPLPVRRGGFGGAAGLARYIRQQGIDTLIDATHPYAAQISTNAAEAAAVTGVSFAVLQRPPWQPVDGDRWSDVADVATAIRHLGETPRRVFLALGRQEIGAFSQAPQHHYLIRSVDPVEPPLAVTDAEYILARGPFDETAELTLLRAHRTDVIVAKNSGGTATYGKIAAARALGIEVVLIRRPPQPTGPSFDTVDGVIAWLDHQPTTRFAGSGNERGV